MSKVKEVIDDEIMKAEKILKGFRNEYDNYDSNSPNRSIETMLRIKTYAERIEFLKELKKRLGVA